MNNKGNNKKIAKNTILLYFRMIITMLVSLFTSRLILNTLGIEDYGIYNVVGGVVSMFGFITGTLSAAISRFLTYELGSGRNERLRIIYSTSINIIITISLVIAIIIEIIGTWFLNNKLNIPIERMFAANCVLQFAIIGFILNLFNVPFNAAIIAHEKMSIFAYISILEVVLKLVIVYMLCISPFDRLITYAALFCLVSLILRIIYGLYCSKNFSECKYSRCLDKNLLKEMTGFAGWNMLGSGAYIFNTQGINILTNLFFDVGMNAARGVTTQVENVIKQFVTNFTTALNPQITKSYAAGNIEYMNSLVCKGAKYSYLMMLFFTIPIIFESDIIIRLWLGNPPEHAALFVKLSVIGAMLDMMGNSTANACWATGKVKKYYQYVASIGCLPFFLTWFLFSVGCQAYSAYITFIVIYFILIFVKLYILKGLLPFSPKVFIKDVILRVFLVTCAALILPGIIWIIMPQTLIRLILLCLLSTISIFTFTYILGLDLSEKTLIRKFIISKLKLNNNGTVLY